MSKRSHEKIGDCEQSSIDVKGTTGVYESIFLFEFQTSKKKREICEFEMDFEKSFLLLFKSK